MTRRSHGYRNASDAHIRSRVLVRPDERKHCGRAVQWEIAIAYPSSNIARDPLRDASGPLGYIGIEVRIMNPFEFIERATAADTFPGVALLVALIAGVLSTST